MDPDRPEFSGRARKMRFFEGLINAILLQAGIVALAALFVWVIWG
jgi:hypothetical protein